MTPPMLRQMRHDVWATEQLIALCRSLAPAQLELSVPGTYGSARRTLAHVVGADERYLARLLGVWDEEPLRETPETTLDDIATHLAHVKEGVERLFARGEFDPDALLRDSPLRRFAPNSPRVEMSAWVPLTQFVHHGNDHRSQIATTLSAHGIEPPDLQVWPLATELGASRPAKDET